MEGTEVPIRPLSDIEKKNSSKKGLLKGKLLILSLADLQRRRQEGY